MGADHQRFLELELALPHADLILAMSAVAGAAFAVVLAVLAQRGVPMLRGPAGYIAAATAGGALLYVIMVHVAAPNASSRRRLSAAAMYTWSRRVFGRPR